MIWLARKLDKAILKLTDHDYNEEGLQDLLAERGPAYDINVKVFRHLQSTITGWPGGKPAHAKQPGDHARRATTFSRSGCSFFRPIRMTT